MEAQLIDSNFSKNQATVYVTDGETTFVYEYNARECEMQMTAAFDNDSQFNYPRQVVEMMADGEHNHISPIKQAAQDCFEENRQYHYDQLEYQSRIDAGEELSSEELQLVA